jgi:hypothetical protein
MIKAECQRRIIAHCGAEDIIGALVRQMNDPSLKSGVDALRSRSNAIEAMEPVPVDFRDDGYWA